MPLDFTTAAFDQFCQRVARLPVYPLAEWLALPAPPPPPSLILRFDVDYREDHAVTLARLAHQRGLRGSFYFRHRRGRFDLDALHAVAALGHEVGYHFETLDTCRGDVECAAARLLEHLGQLRAAGLEVRTAAAHGAPPTASTYRDNLDLFRRQPDLLERAGLIGETTLSVDFGRLVYCSDANWRWRRYRDFAPSARGQPSSLAGILRELDDPQAALYVNFHPQQWFSSAPASLYFRARNRLGRRVYRALGIRPR